jgi:DNA-binding MarR family transcriptional regulator
LRGFVDRAKTRTHERRIRVPLTLTSRRYIDETQRGAGLT